MRSGGGRVRARWQIYYSPRPDLSARRSGPECARRGARFAQRLRHHREILERGLPPHTHPHCGPGEGERARDQLKVRGNGGESERKSLARPECVCVCASLNQVAVRESVTFWLQLLLPLPSTVARVGTGDNLSSGGRAHTHTQEAWRARARFLVAYRTFSEQ